MMNQGRSFKRPSIQLVIRTMTRNTSNALLGMSTLDRLLGNLVQAENESREAVAFARQRGLETLAEGGIIELGNAMIERR